jgi:hypothetical protein
MGGSHFVEEKKFHLPGIRPLSLGNAAHGAWPLYRKISLLNTQIMKQQRKGTPSKLLARNEKCGSVYYLLRNDEAKTVFVNPLVFVSCMDVQTSMGRILP